MNIERLRKELRALLDRLEEFRQLKAEDRTPELRTRRDGDMERARELSKQIHDIEAGRTVGNGPPPVDPDEFGTGDGDHRGYQLRTANQKKDYRSLFGEHPRNEYRWPDSESNFFEAVFSGRHHPGLVRRMREGISGEGGFLIPSETAAEIHNVSLENEICMPLANVQPMTSSEKNFPAVTIGSHYTSLFGGFIASYVAENGTIPEHDPKFQNMKLTLRKLTGLMKFSNELLQDLSDGGRQIVEICGKGLAWYRDKAFLKGSGAGEPLGILNSPCLITVDEESGQVADTIVYENLTNMMSKMYAGSFKNSVWICHQTTIPALLSLCQVVGTGGNHIPVLTKSKDGQFEILTRPVIFSEKSEPLGEVGDIILADFSQYVIGLREEMSLAWSPHKYFETDQTLARLIERHDGMPLWDQPLTLEDGATTVSPFVTLAAR